MGRLLPPDILPGMFDLRWQSDDDDGYRCLDGETAIGRVRPVPMGQPGEGMWNWFAGFYCEPNAGREESRRGAMVALEAAFERHLTTYPNAREMYPYPVKR